MKYYKLDLFLYCVLAILAPILTSKKILIQKYLNETIDNPNYDKRIIPDGTGGPDTPVRVNVTMFIFDISTLNEQTMDFEAQFYLRQSWVDRRLKYDIPGVDQIFLTDADKIWTPDLFFMQEIEGSLHEITQPNIFYAIKPSGRVFSSAKLSERIICEMDLRSFPHDSQKCEIRIESFAYGTDYVMLKWPNEYSVGISRGPLEFHIGMFYANEQIVNISSGSYSALTVPINFKRDTGYFLKQMHMPFALLVLLSWMSFWISPEKYHRIVLLLIILHKIVTKKSELDRWIPYTPYLKASDIWMDCCEAMLFAAILESIFVSLLFGRKSEANHSSAEITMSTNSDNEPKENVSYRFWSFLAQVSKNVTEVKRRANCSTHPVDRISRFVFPTFFVIFNIVYWSTYGF